MSQLLLIVLLTLSGVLSLSLINYFTNRRLKKYSQVDNDKIGINILKAVLFLCAGLLISEVGNATKEVLNIQSFGVADNWMFLVSGYFTLFFSITIVVLFVVVWFAKMVFAIFSKGINIYEAASRNDFANILLFAGIAICISFIVKSGLLALLLNAIQYSSTPIFH